MGEMIFARQLCKGDRREQARLRRPEAETLFWVAMSLVVFGGLLFSVDSPVALGRNFPLVGRFFLVALALAVQVHNSHANYSRLREPDAREQAEWEATLHQARSRERSTLVAAGPVPRYGTAPP